MTVLEFVSEEKIAAYDIMYFLIYFFNPSVSSQMMPMVSVASMTSGQPGPVYITQAAQPQQQAQAIVSTDGTSVTLAPNAQPLPDVAVSMSSVQSLAPAIIPSPASINNGQAGQSLNSITTTIAGSATSVDSSAAPVVADAPSQPPSIDPAATGTQTAEALEGSSTSNSAKVDNGE